MESNSYKLGELSAVVDELTAGEYVLQGDESVYVEFASGEFIDVAKIFYDAQRKIIVIKTAKDLSLPVVILSRLRKNMITGWLTRLNKVEAWALRYLLRKCKAITPND